MTDKTKDSKLVEKFNAAAQRLQGTTDSHVLQIETRNLCEKFDLLWDMAEDRPQQKELSTLFANVLYNLAFQIKTQPTSLAADATTGLAVKLFNTLKAKDADWVDSSNLSKLFQDEAAVLAGQAKQQPNEPAQDALTRAADTLTLLADASKPAAAPAKMSNNPPARSAKP